MAIQCIYCLSDPSSCCQVLDLLGGDVSRDIKHVLAEQFCHSGHFIGCPVFRKVEEQLADLEKRAVRGANQEYKKASNGFCSEIRTPFVDRHSKLGTKATQSAVIE